MIPASMKRLLFTLLLLVSAAAATADRMVLEVIELEHRLARDVLPIVLPVLAEGGTATGTSSRLIVRSTPENLADIRKVLNAIDTRIRQLRITVTQDLSAVVEAEADAVSGHVRSGDFAVGVPDQRPLGGSGAGLDNARGSLTYHTQRARAQGDSSNTYSIVGMDGQPAFITTGQRIPQPYYEPAYGGTVTDYHTVSSGVYVTPRLQGDRVVLSIAPQLESADPDRSGAITTRSAETTVTGRLGEWISLGGVSTTSGHSDAELLARTRRQGDNRYSLWIKVEEQP